MLSTKLSAIKGVKLAAVAAGIKKKDRQDLLLIELAEGSVCAGVFTTNAFCAAPVTLAKENLSYQPRWLLINSGNANAGTGQQGMLNAQLCCQAVARLNAASEKQVLPFSTGVIGESLPADRIVEALPAAKNALSENAWEEAAKAIMTTDTRPKMAAITLKLGDQEVSINGIAKGSGMIHPNMATMLAFIATDAGIQDQSLLNKILQSAVDSSFNRITVDGDTSTNDACMLMATGQAKVVVSEDSPYLGEFSNAISLLCQQLAEEIVRDGEGATKFIRINVKDAASNLEAHQVANTIALSPLVKTAFFASDPNWGRILAAVGRAGIQDLDISRINIFLGKVCIVKQGQRNADYTESAGQEVMSKTDIDITVSLGRGDASETVKTCDFSYDYVRINAEYRT